MRAALSSGTLNDQSQCAQIMSCRVMHGSEHIALENGVSCVVTAIEKDRCMNGMPAAEFSSRSRISARHSELCTNVVWGC